MTREGAEVSRGARFLLGLCVFTSSACSLGFEVIWAKQLRVVLGGIACSIKLCSAPGDLVAWM